MIFTFKSLKATILKTGFISTILFIPHEYIDFLILLFVYSSKISDSSGHINSLGEVKICEIYLTTSEH